MATKITDIMEEIMADFCDHYCKFPDMYDDSDESQDRLMEEHCDKCPLVERW